MFVFTTYNVPSIFTAVHKGHRLSLLSILAAGCIYDRMGTRYKPLQTGPNTSPPICTTTSKETRPMQGLQVHCCSFGIFCLGMNSSLMMCLIQLDCGYWWVRSQHLHPHHNGELHFHMVFVGRERNRFGCLFTLLAPSWPLLNAC